MANELKKNVPQEEILYCTQEDLIMECGSSSTTGNDYQIGSAEALPSDNESPTARVLAHLDDVLRNRLNLEFEEFHESLHKLLDEQLCHVRHLVSISQHSPPTAIQEMQDNIPGENGSKGDENLNWTSQEDAEKRRENTEDEKTRLVLKLMTVCSSISQKLQGIT